ncbi:MAG: hypothetical protein GC193_12090, partial [Cryomorphaceae bacterium]|nr:hypothetical protein [Cryomorphaceae bacterium]
MTNVYKTLNGLSRPWMALILPLFLFLFSWNNADATCCNVNFPSMTAQNGCATLGSIPVGQCGDQVEWMWAQNVNGSIVGLTGFSTSQLTAWCPSAAGNFRICARVIGCSTIYESSDVYVNPSCCEVNLPSISAVNGCAQLSGAPTAVCGGSVEWMWAQNINGSIVGLTGFSTTQSLSWCPSSAGNFRICVRKVGCSTIYEGNDVYVDPATCTGSITGIYIYDQATDARAAGLPALYNGMEIDLGSLPANYYLVAELSGNAESVRFNLNGNQIVENALPYTFPSGADSGTNWNGGIGSFNITATSFLQDNAAGQQCDVEAINFSIVDATCVSISNGSSPYQENDPIFQQVIAADSYCCNTWWDNQCEDQYIDIITNGDPETICTLDGYQATNGRVFWIPNFATDYRNSGAGLSFAKYADGSAHIYGTIESAANTNNKFKVSIWFNNESNYAEWLAAGKQAKEPQLGDESTWTFYMHDEVRVSYLQGLGGHAGQLLYIHEMDNNFGLQIGDGANALNANANGISMWFDHVGTNSGHGDLNGTITCPPTCDFTLTTTTNETACNANDGSLIVCPALGSNTALPYTLTYTFNGNTFSAGPFNTADPISISGLEPGAYTNLVFTDATGCSQTQAGPFNIAENQDCGNCDFVVLDQWDNNYNCYICSDGFTSTILAAYGGNAGDVIQFQDPVCNPNECVSSITITFNVAAADYSLSQSWNSVQQIATAYPIEINGQVIGYYDPTELPYICNVCEPEGSKTVTFNVDPATFNYNYGGLNTFDSNFYQFGNDNGILQDVCVANIELAFNTTSCDPCVNSTLSVNAGDDQVACGVAEASFTATVAGAADCSTESNSDCNHTLGVTGGWLENPSASAVCGDNAGTKLWTLSGQGASFVTLDLGVVVPAGTQICANMKLEHCNGSTTTNSSAKIKASTNPNSDFVTVVSAQTFSNNSYQEFCYTLAAPARYIRVQDNGSCAFRVDYVEYTTQGTPVNDVTYTWSGPGIVGVANSATVVANASGTYTVTVTDCSGCSATDEVNLTVDPTELEIKNLGNCIVDVYEWLPSGDQFVIELGPGEHIIVTTHVGAMWRIVADNWNTAAFDEQYTVIDCEDQVWNVAPDYCNPDCDLSVSIDAEPGLSVCEGESITLTANAAGETVCDEIIACYTMGNAIAPASCFATPGTGVIFQRAAGCAGSHSIWQAGNDLKLTEFADNTARITGSITRNGQVGIVDVVLYDKANNGTTWNSSCYLNNINGPESFYTSFLGTITINGAEFTVEEKVSEKHYILANGAGFNSNQFGLGAWTAGTFGGCTEWFSNLTPCDIPSLETTYVWSTGETTESIVVDESGTYSVIVTDCAGCVAQDEVTITIHELPEVSVSSTNPVCLENDGTITFSFNDNPNRSSIEFSLDGGVTYPLNVADNSGSASFNNLSAGTYNLFVRWGNDECPVDLGPITLTAVECASLGNYVWFDADRDGIQDAGENGVEGVTVELFICGETDAIQSTETDANGLYLFSNLEPGVSYYVVFSGLPADYVFSPQNNGNDATDSDAGLNGETACVELAPGEFNDTLDAGINQPVASLGNYVWFDTDRDGIQDADENGVEGVTVELFICGETDAIQSTETDSNGLYLFSNLEPGVSYYVVFSGLPADYVFSPQNNGNDATDSDAGLNGETACVELAPGEFNDTLDAGINNPTGSIGNYVWEDIDQDGFQDAGENGVEGVTVELFICGETDAIQSTETDANGLYLFSNLEPGVSYYVVFSGLPAGYDFTTANSADDASDSDADENGATACYELGIDEDYLDFDAGIFIPTNIGNFVWYDNDNDGIQDAGENGVEGVTVNLVTAGTDGVFGTDDDVTVATQSTDENGFYLFEDVLAGEYIIVFDPTTLPTDFVFTALDKESDDELDSDANPLTGATVPFTVVYGQDDDLSFDAGITTCPYPVLEGAEPQDLTINCDATIPVAAILTFSDFIYGLSDVNFTFVQNDLDCGHEIVRTWTATNECGNTTIVDQTITVIDNVAPVITFQTPDQTIECDQEIPQIVVTYLDNCDNDLYLEVDNWVNDLDCGFEYVKWCRATDDCGNSNEATVTITVLDTTAPVATFTPASVTIECDEVIPSDMPTFVDNCDDDLEVIPTYEEIALECGYEIHKSWTAIDDCQNETTVSQVITVVDTTSPVFTFVPEDYVVNCDNGSSDPQFAGMPVVTDNCDDAVSLTYADGIAGTDCPASFERVWTAIDNCNNQSVYVQMISINDFLAPVLVVPSDITIECTESTDPSVTGSATASDDCSTPVVSYVDGPVSGSCPYSFERTWTAIDPCGNTSTEVQTITIDDTIAPVADGVGQEITISCEEDLPAVGMTFTDNCDQTIEVTVTTWMVPVGCLYDFYQSCTATDDCGNSTTVTSVIHVVDVTAPVLYGVPADATINCNDAIPSAIVYAQDNCDDNVIVALSATTEQLACGYEITRTWSAIDDCGNEVSATQVLTVTDTEAPVITCPAPYTVNCDNGSSDPEFAGEPVVTDNCSTFTVSYADGVAGTDCPASFERTWTAVDACGNESSCVQIITINDFAAPAIACPSDVTIECTESTDPSNTGSATATDDCSTPTILYVDGATTGDCPYTFTRTWTAVDACGNESSCDQVITIIDTVSPVLSGQDEETTIECSASINLVAPTATDNCDDNVEITPSVETIPGDCPNSWTEVYTWTATDNCGNQSAR